VFDVVQDIFPETDDLCDIQVGLTGTFALLMGYALGLPPLFNTQTGMAGVGVFGLMDHGSNNGRGVIPAPLTAWTRINQGWSESVTISNESTITISSRDQNGQIYRVDISSKEYFLIENRNNWIFENADIDSLRRKEEHKVSDDQIGHWFDTVLGELSEIEFDTLGGVFTKFPKVHPIPIKHNGLFDHLKPYVLPFYAMNQYPHSQKSNYYDFQLENTLYLKYQLGRFVHFDPES
jgi:hypothetical protein